MMAVIMVLIPGIAITNAMREVLISDTISGILRLVESLLIASAVAFGFALAMFVFKGRFPQEHFTSLDADLLWLQVLAAAVGTLGFAILFNSRPRRLFLGALGGGLTWVVYLLLSDLEGSDFLCVALAAAFGAVYAEIMALQGPGHGVHHPLRDRPDPRREPVHHHAPPGGRTAGGGPSVRPAHRHGGPGHRGGHRPCHRLHHQLLLQEEAGGHGPQALIDVPTQG